MPHNNNVLIMSWGMPQIMRFTQTALKRMGYNPTTVFRGEQGGTQWVNTAIEYIQEHRPKWLFTWQRLYGQARPIWRMARACGVRQVVMDFGVWPHYMTAYYDPKGENYESSLVGNFDALEANPVQREATDRQMRVVQQMRDTIEQSAEGGLDIARRLRLTLPGERDFVFLALQRAAHGRPDKVLELDAVPSRRQPLQIAQDVIREAERQGRFVVIKQHPQGKDITDDMPERGPNYWMMPIVKGRPENEMLFGWCIKNCSHLVSVNSTTWSIAAVCEKPVAMLGRGWYTRNSIVRECGLIRDAIPTPECAGERAKRFVALMLSRQLRHALCERPHELRKTLRLIYPGEAW